LALMAAAIWTFLNDAVDYGFQVFPYLPLELDDDLTAVCVFTILLTAFSVAAAGLARFRPDSSRSGADRAVRSDNPF
jgi:uncharacterized membrane protein YpjA